MLKRLNLDGDGVFAECDPRVSVIKHLENLLQVYNRGDWRRWRAIKFRQKGSDACALEVANEQLRNTKLSEELNVSKSMSCTSARCRRRRLAFVVNRYTLAKCRRCPRRWEIKFTSTCRRRGRPIIDDCGGGNYWLKSTRKAILALKNVCATRDAWAQTKCREFNDETEMSSALHLRSISHTRSWMVFSRFLRLCSLTPPWAK